MSRRVQHLTEVIATLDPQRLKASKAEHPHDCLPCHALVRKETNSLSEVEKVKEKKYQFLHYYVGSQGVISSTIPAKEID
jgi:hypothetical protein